MKPKKSPSEEAVEVLALRRPRTTSLKTKPKTAKLVGDAAERIATRAKSGGSKQKLGKSVGDAVESVPTKQKLAKLVGRAVESVSPRTKSTAAKQKPPRLVGDAPASAGLPPPSDFGAASRRGTVESVPTGAKSGASKQKLGKSALAAGMEQHKVPTSRGLGSVPTRVKSKTAKPKTAKLVGDAVETTAPAARTRPAPAKKPALEQPLSIPAILLEGDEPAALPVSGPGQKYALGPVPPTGHSGSEEGELPEAYGTRKLMLLPRDPHWLYAHWDLTNEQQRRYNASSTDRHLVIRVYRDAVAGQPATEIHVHPESRHWFIHVVQAETKYVAELGYYNAGGRWVAITVSGTASTPSETASSDRSTEFATMPPPPGWRYKNQRPGASAEQWVQMAEFALAREFLGRALAENTLAEGSETLAPAPWTSGQERALAEVMGVDEERRHWINSMEISELIRRQVERDISSMTAGQIGAGASEALSSPPGYQQPQAKGFWFNVNAELIIYGATEPDAKVTMAGRPIKLRPDGTFSFHFALPDGQYHLGITATSAANDQRQAQLNFGRRTEHTGEVGTHPQDKALPRMTAAK